MTSLHVGPCAKQYSDPCTLNSNIWYVGDIHCGRTWRPLYDACSYHLFPRMSYSQNMSKREETPSLLEWHVVDCWRSSTKTAEVSSATPHPAVMLLVLNWCADPADLTGKGYLTPPVTSPGVSHPSCDLTRNWTTTHSWRPPSTPPPGTLSGETLGGCLFSTPCSRRALGYSRRRRWAHSARRPTTCKWRVFWWLQTRLCSSRGGSESSRMMRPGHLVVPPLAYRVCLQRVHLSIWLLV